MKCVLSLTLVLLLLALVVYGVFFQSTPSVMSQRLSTSSEDGKKESYLNPEFSTMCDQVDAYCRDEYGNRGDDYCHCMAQMGCSTDWCKCYTVVNQCAAKSESRKEYCECISKSECADRMECNEDTRLDCGEVFTKCKYYYPEDAKACVLFHGCKPDTDPECLDCAANYAKDAFTMGACQLCRGCEAKENIYDDWRDAGKLAKCDLIPPYVPPKPTLTPEEQEMKNYLKVNPECGLTKNFNFGDYFESALDKHCYCCTGIAKNNNQFDSCNCNDVDCTNRSGTLGYCNDFMKKFAIDWANVPDSIVDVKKQLTADQQAALRP